MNGSQTPCLLIHGFTGGPYEVEPLARYLETNGTYCRLYTLPGHDRQLHGLKTAGWQEWVRASEIEAEQLSFRYGQFDVVGFSMGGLLAAYLANRYPVRRLVLLNAAVIYVSPRRMVNEIGSRILRGDRFRDWNKATRTPLRALHQFMQLGHALRPEFAEVTVPTLVAQGELDPIIHPRSAHYIMNRLAGPKQLYMYPNSRHMICYEAEAESLFRTVGLFLGQERELRRERF
ncbi:alpha/beta hydrolase [Paenibacillus thalictri]|uniref:Alpha/beta fold hydrolase n=1 Tax=Paenibacillus thalictri TaxID=2527873 RepID=A0A4Q9DTD7_9BACL|nr:alpha/beta fold hydrolase [Paenibacillus thalictri]TBL80196.1 alpha/beta fold hydrolase [Paenibacillus thalictri]